MWSNQNKKQHLISEMSLNIEIWIKFFIKIPYVKVPLTEGSKYKGKDLPHILQWVYFIMFY